MNVVNKDTIEMAMVGEVQVIQYQNVRVTRETETESVHFHVEIVYKDVNLGFITIRPFTLVLGEEEVETLESLRSEFPFQQHLCALAAIDVEGQHGVWSQIMAHASFCAYRKLCPMKLGG